MRSRQPTSLERVRFGPTRTLNVRAGRLTGVEAASRVEGWLRSKQVEMGGEVLVITGRGAGSIGGVPVIKNATHRVLNRLRRLGVVASFGEETAGSFVVELAPLRSLLEAPARRRSPVGQPTRRAPAIHGLKPATRDRLHYLSTRAIDSLGVKDVSEDQVAREMVRQFTVIVRSAPAGVDTDSWVDAAITRALREYEESDR
jgi:hypothetical protein